VLAKLWAAFKCPSWRPEQMLVVWQLNVGWSGSERNGVVDLVRLVPANTLP